MKDAAPWPGIQPGPPALGVQSTSYWPARLSPSSLCVYLTRKIHCSPVPWAVWEAPVSSSENQVSGQGPHVWDGQNLPQSGATPASTLAEAVHNKPLFWVWKVCGVLCFEGASEELTTPSRIPQRLQQRRRNSVVCPGFAVLVCWTTWPGPGLILLPPSSACSPGPFTSGTLFPTSLPLPALSAERQSSLSWFWTQLSSHQVSSDPLTAKLSHLRSLWTHLPPWPRLLFYSHQSRSSRRQPLNSTLMPPQVLAAATCRPERRTHGSWFAVLTCHCCPGRQESIVAKDRQWKLPKNACHLWPREDWRSGRQDRLPSSTEPLEGWRLTGATPSQPPPGSDSPPIGWRRDGYVWWQQARSFFLLAEGGG